MSRPRLRRISMFPLWLEVLARAAAALRYRVRVSGAERVPGAGGAILIANHISYADVVVLQLASPRPLRFVGYEDERSPWFFRAIFRLAGVIPISSRRPTAGMRRALAALARGELLCLFPEGQIARTCQLQGLKRGFSILARRSGAPVVPVGHDGLWGSLFSFSGGRYLRKRPQWGRRTVHVAFGETLAAADPAAARAALLRLWSEAFGRRAQLGGHLAREAVRALAARPGRLAVVDRTAERRPLSAAAILAAAAVLSRRLRATVPEARVGIVLPPGAGAVIANLAVACAGKVPVNLNFTAGRAAVEGSLRLAGVRTVLSAAALREKLPGFPWPERTLDLRAELAAAGGKRALLPWLAGAWLLPGSLLADRLGLPRAGGDAEAALLFTSGSSGEPRGVVLTHRNLLANCTQFALLSVCPPGTILLGCLPVFHSFGFTVTLWYPLLRRSRLVTVPSPLETRRLVDAIREEGVKVLVGAPTFLRPFLKKARPEELRSLCRVVAGAEKLPAELHRSFLEAFGISILEGYGMTEAAPVASVNQPDPPATTATASPQPGGRVGTVGRLLPGLEGRIADPDTGAELVLGETGMVWLRGPNVFPGYLGPDGRIEPATREGWYPTFDLGAFDADGFLTLSGRLSRFSKIGGEMVSHGAIEERIAELFGLDQSEGPAVFVAGVPDEAKGEALVLLARAELTAEAVRERLRAAGVPNLWIPKRVRRVERIPLLGSGKLDLAAARALAREP